MTDTQQVATSITSTAFTEVTDEVCAVLPDVDEDAGQRSTIRCDATLVNIGSWTLVRLPESASAQLPSRGMVMIEGTINGVHFHAPLEPDGKGSHWFRVDDTLGAAVGAGAGDTVTLVMEPMTEWPRPEVPEDVQTALATVPQAYTLWTTLTPKAQWDWMRWIRATNNPDTRRRRIEVACSKLTSGMRRPCCFNRNLCTEPAVSHHGVLGEPTQGTV